MVMKQLATRTKRHPLSKAQLEVLRYLATDPRGQAYTSNRTGAGYVAGTAAAALDRRGLVTVSYTAKNYGHTAVAIVTLTNAGRKVLARARRAENECESC